MPKGTVSMTTVALVRLSNWATSTKKITTSAMVKVRVSPEAVSSSFAASPRNSKPIPDGRFSWARSRTFSTASRNGRLGSMEASISMARR